jgi:hypothetical protein
VLTRYLLALAAAGTWACGGQGDGRTPAENPTPGVSAVAPTELVAGTDDRALAVTGSDFVRGAVVQVDGSARSTEYVSRTQLRATLLAADVERPRTAQLTVTNPAPGGGLSNAMPLTIGMRVNPAPTVAALSPASATAGSGATTVTVTGTGFVAESRGVVGGTSGAALATTYVSATQLQVVLPDTLLAAGRTLQVSVVNPWPGGGASTATAFEVRTPVPTLGALGATQATAGQPGLTLRVTGTGFVRNSQVRANEAPRPTQFVSATALDVTLDEGDLRVAGTLSITVLNAGPGGGASNALPLTLVNGAPEITLLPSSGASAGRPGFTLTVHGRGFVQGSVVRWNGADLPTQYLSGTRLSATVGAGDVATPRAVQVTVVNPAPGGGTSSPAALAVRAVGAPTVTSSQTLTLNGRDLVWDAPSARLYVTIAGTAPTDGNSVVAVDPAAGTVTARAFVGSEPRRIVRSDNGQYLYVGLNGASAVRRVTVAGLAPGLQWSLNAGQVAGDLEVMPGRQGTVAVSRHRPGFSPPLDGVTVYDDGVARPTSSPGHTGGNRIVFLDDPAVLYGYNNAHTGFEFFTIALDAAGARHAATSGGLISGFYTDIEGAAGRVYSTAGHVVDAGRRQLVGTFSGVGTFSAAASVAVDPRTGRAFFVNETGVGVYDLNTFQLLGTIPLGATAGFDHPALAATRLVRWGEDGLAFLDQTKLYLLRSPLVAP